MTIEERIKQVEKEIALNVNKAEQEGFAKYYPYIKQYVDMSKVLKEANRIKYRLSPLNVEDF